MDLSTDGINVEYHRGIRFEESRPSGQHLLLQMLPFFQTFLYTGLI